MRIFARSAKTIVAAATVLIASALVALGYRWLALDALERQQTRLHVQLVSSLPGGSIAAPEKERYARLLTAAGVGAARFYDPKGQVRAAIGPPPQGVSDDARRQPLPEGKPRSRLVRHRSPDGAPSQWVRTYVPAGGLATGPRGVWMLQSQVTPLVQRTNRETAGVFGVVVLLLGASAALASLLRKRLPARPAPAGTPATVTVSRHDELTGLPNRTQFFELLHRSIARAERMGTGAGVLILGLDRFKEINDGLGHEVGDAVLSETARRIRQRMRRNEPVCRIGGDEFAVILEDLPSAEHAGSCAERLLALFQQAMSMGNHEIVVSPSIGIALYPEDTQDAERLVEDADAAMHRAKHLGRNRYVFFTRELNERARRRQELEIALRKALQSDQFVLHYQPKVETRNGEVVGMEALVRWEHPQDGLISPAAFVPLLEDTGLIVPVGEWVLREACRQCRAWLDQGLGGLRLSVNVSLQQFKSPRLIHDVASVLEDTGLPSEYLELELTESVLVEDTEHAVEVLRELKALGVSLSIDDFGTGYSSLGYLMHLPVDYLKVDRSFVRDVHSNRHHAAITTAITAMARSLNLQVVAEGVETMEEMRFVTALGCSEVQGFLYSKPVPGHAFPEMLHRIREQRGAPARAAGSPGPP